MGEVYGEHVGQRLADQAGSATPEGAAGCLFVIESLTHVASVALALGR
jgi:hypothetical protein